MWTIYTYTTIRACRTHAVIPLRSKTYRLRSYDVNAQTFTWTIVRMRAKFCWFCTPKRRIYMLEGNSVNERIHLLSLSPLWISRLPNVVERIWTWKRTFYAGEIGKRNVKFGRLHRNAWVTEKIGTGFASGHHWFSSQLGFLPKCIDGYSNWRKFYLFGPATDFRSCAVVVRDLSWNNYTNENVQEFEILRWGGTDWKCEKPTLAEQLGWTELGISLVIGCLKNIMGSHRLPSYPNHELYSSHGDTFAHKWLQKTLAHIVSEFRFERNPPFFHPNFIKSNLKK